MELFRWMQPLVLCIACEAPFIGVNGDKPESAGQSDTSDYPPDTPPENAAAGMSAAGYSVSGLTDAYDSPDGGMGGGSSNPAEPTNQSGQNGLAGQGGQPEIGNNWECRFSDEICQCYSDPSIFEPDWLDRIDCPNNNWCTLRQEKACVCWATEEQYLGALSNPDTIPVNKCPGEGV